LSRSDELQICHETATFLGKEGYLKESTVPQTVYTLEDEFCEVYYTGTGDCVSLRNQIQTHDELVVPYITLGDPSHPPMLFLHGWPDTYALWVNQFEHFCMPPHGKFYCVALTWFGFVPASSDVDLRNMGWVQQIEAWESVATALDLSNVTVVMHDFGAVIGYGFVYRFFERVARIVALDVGNYHGPAGGENTFQTPPWTQPTPSSQNDPGNLLLYQQINSCAYLTDNTTLIREGAHHVNPPCIKLEPNGYVCESLTGATGWPYYQLTNASRLAGLAPDVPDSTWEFNMSPTIPDVPLLFLYGSGFVQDGKLKPRTSCFFDEFWWSYLAGNSNTAAAGVEGAEHWFLSRAAGNTNAIISQWLADPGSIPAPATGKWTSRCPPL
jgi:pimeloyl-ACP methyl ester carboxylesterase